MTSRLARKKQKQLWMQTALFSILAIVFALGFFFYVLPASVNFFFKLIGTEIESSSVSNIPPQVPIFSSPPEASSEQTITIDGFAQSGTEVVFLLNTTEYKRQDVDDEGEFSVEIELNEGENLLAAYAVSEDSGLESNVSREYTIVFDNTQPSIELSSPSPGEEIVGKDSQELTITGITEPEARLSINGRLDFADEEGNFSHDYRLSEGENTITIKATDEAGNEAELEFSISFRL